MQLTFSLSLSLSQAHNCRLKEKILELETFRDIAVRQAETLQGYFDKTQTLANNALQEEGMKRILYFLE